MNNEYSSECDANDLIRAEEIRSDKDRYKAAMEIIGNKKKVINSISGLRDKYQEAVENEDNEEEKPEKSVKKK